jgi:hypothetical protein
VHSDSLLQSDPTNNAAELGYKEMADSSAAAATVGRSPRDRIGIIRRSETREAMRMKIPSIVSLVSLLVQPVFSQAAETRWPTRGRSTGV